MQTPAVAGEAISAVLRCSGHDDTKPSANAMPTTQPLRSSFSSVWLFTSIPDTFRVKTDSTERLWESVKFTIDSGLKPGIIDAHY